jgi:uncharacterized protein with HEPN domain
MRNEKLYLVDIVEAAEAIERFVASLEWDDFLRDDLRQSAVLQKLTVIGEAAARLPQSFRDQHPEIEWRDIIAFRNILVHSYFSVKLPIIWEAVTQDVPDLREKVVHILTQEYK